MAVAVLRYVQTLEANETYTGVVTADAVAAAVDANPRMVKAELERLLEDRYLDAADHAEDFDGGLDISAPRLTTGGVAALAR